MVIPELRNVDAFDKYACRGNILRYAEPVPTISSDVQLSSQYIVGKTAEPLHFYFVQASSGAGKTQLAFALDAPVIYIPLSTIQPVYRGFQFVSAAVQNAVDSDIRAMGAIVKRPPAGELYWRPTRFEAVGLLTALWHAVHGKTNIESLRILSGRDGRCQITYSPMSLVEARKSIRDAVRQAGSAQRLPIFMIDEAPAKEYSSYDPCIVLRNFIRCMQCVCLLAGTEADAMNSIDSVEPGSRGESESEYMRLITRLPSTDWRIFSADPQYRDLVSRLHPDTTAMLKHTRPLFAEHVLQAMLPPQTDGKNTTRCACDTIVLHCCTAHVS